MSFTRPQNPRSPFQQNSRQTGNGQQSSPQMKKQRSCPVWGSGALTPNNTATGVSRQFSSPTSYNLTSPPSFNRPASPLVSTPTPQQYRQQQHHHQQFRPTRNYSPSPRHHAHGNTQFRPRHANYGQQMFRTPQPMNKYPLSPQSWSCDKNFRPNFKNPRRNPYQNPGGSNNIELYYHPSMLADPWQKLSPIPVNHKPTATT